MYIRTFVMISFSLMFLGLSNCTTHNAKCITMDFTAGLDNTKHKAITMFSGDAFREVYYCKVGNYYVVTPTKSSDDSLLIFKDNPRVISIYYSKGFGMNVYNPVNGILNNNVVINLQDRNEDGVYDWISYNVLDNNGKIRISLIDMNLDGIPDIKTENDIGYVWFNENWRPIEIINGKRGVREGNEWSEVYFLNGKWELKI